MPVVHGCLHLNNNSVTESEAMVATTENSKKTGNGSQKRTSASNSNRNGQSNGSAESTANKRRGGGSRTTPKRTPEVPSWLGTVVSVVGMGVAVGAGLYATRRQWMPKAHEWKDDFSAAFADDETDYENFDQTRHAGTASMRDDQADDWEDIDDMSDASFPASDPPSFNPGTAG